MPRLTTCVLKRCRQLGRLPTRFTWAVHVQTSSARGFCSSIAMPAALPLANQPPCRLSWNAVPTVQKKKVESRRKRRQSEHCGPSDAGHRVHPCNLRVRGYPPCGRGGNRIQGVRKPPYGKPRRVFCAGPSGSCASSAKAARALNRAALETN